MCVQINTFKFIHNNVSVCADIQSQLNIYIKQLLGDVNYLQHINLTIRLLKSLVNYILVGRYYGIHYIINKIMSNPQYAKQMHQYVLCVRTCIHRIIYAYQQ